MVTRNNLNTYITPDANNQVLKPAQPAFLAYLSGSDATVTGDATLFILGDTDVGTALTEDFDQNADFVTGSSTGAIFTAPVTGRYYLSGSVWTSGYDGTQTEILYDIKTSNGFYSIIRGEPTNLREVNFYIVELGGCICDMDSADTAYIEVTSSGGNKVVTVNGSSHLTSFSGYLVV